MQYSLKSHFECIYLYEQIIRVYLVTYRPMEDVVNSLYKTDDIAVGDYTAALWAVGYI